jgi:O-antigen/teichoic acid export membrane protein
LTFWPALAIAVIFAAFGPFVLGLFGPGFERGYAALLILTLGQLVSAFVGPVVNLLNMTGHQAVTARVLTASATLAVVAGLLLTQAWGAIGTAVAFSAATLLWNARLAVFLVRKLEVLPSFLRR